MNVCLDDPSPAGSRDAAIISLMYAGGLRRSEVANASNYNNGKLVITGKGNKERIIYIDNGAKEAIEDWISIRGYWKGAIFCPINKSGKLLHKKMTTQAVYNILQKRAEQAG